MSTRWSLVALVLLGVVREGSSTSYSWSHGAGGNYNTATNWTPNGIPSTGADSGTFPNLAGSYEVDVTSSVSPGTIALNGSATVVLATQGGSTLAINTITGADLATLTLSGSVSASTISNAVGTFTVGGPLSGSQALTITGGGTVVLSGTNTYTGGTTIDTGTTLSIASQANIGGSTAPITLGGGTLSISGSVTTSGDITLSASSIINGTFTSTGTLTGGANINGTGPLSLNTVSIPASGTLAIGAPLTGSNNITVQGGELHLTNTMTDFSGQIIVPSGASLSIGATTNVGTGTINMQGGRLAVNGDSTALPVINSPIILTNTSDFQTVEASVTDGKLNGLISGPGQLRVIIGSLDVTGVNNTFSGGLYIEAGLPNGGTCVTDPTGVGTGPITLNGGFFCNYTSFAADWTIFVTGNGLTSTISGDQAAIPSYLDLTGTLTGSDGASLDTLGAVSLRTVSVPTGTFTIIGNLSDPHLASGSLTVQGGGTLVLSGTNTYTGGTIIDSGVTLSIGSVTNIGGGTTPITLAGGTLLTTGAVSTSGAISVTANSAINGGTFTSTGTVTGASGLTLTCSGTVALSTISNPSGTFTVAGPLSGAGALTVQGGATIALTGTSTYSGGTTVASGTTLSISSANNIGGATGALTLQTATLMATGAVSTSGTVSVTGASTINATGGDVSFSGAVSGAGSLTVSGSHKLTLTDALNDFTGGVTVNSGATFVIPSIACMGSGNLTLNGGTFAPSAPISTNRSVNVTAADSTLDATAGALTLTGTLTGSSGASLNTVGTVSLNTISNAMATFTVAGNLAGSQLLTIQGGGTVVLSGTNTYSGGTTIDSSTTLSIGSASNIGGSSAALTLSGGTLLTTGPVTTSGAVSVTASSAINGTFTSTGTLTGSNGSTLTCSGTVSLNTISNGAGTFTVAGPLSGTQTLTVQGGATVALSGTNTYTGGTVIDSGTTLSIGSANNIGGSSSTLTLAGGTLLTTADVTLSGAISVTANSAINGGTFTSTGILTGSSGKTLTCSNTVSLNTISNASGTFTVAGPLSGSQVLTVQGGGTIALSGTNTYSGGTVIASSTTLSIASMSNVGSGTITLAGGTLAPSMAISTGNAVNVTAAGSAIDGTAGALTLTGTLTGSSGANLTCSGTVSLHTVSVDSGSFTIGGTLAGTQTFTKTGAGTLIFTSNNTYTQLTTVSQGTLTLQSATLAGGVAVSSGATLNGVGTIGGDLTLNGGTVRPGNSPGTLHIGGDFVVADAASIIAIEVTPSGACSLLDVTGQAQLNNNGVLQVLPDAGLYNNQSFTILTATGGVQNEFASFSLPLGFAAELIYNPFSVVLSLSGSAGIPLNGLTGNNRVVAEYLNSVAAGLGPTYTTLVNLALLGGTALYDALTTISPSRNAFATYLSEVTLLSCSDIVAAHAAELRMMRDDLEGSSLVSHALLAKNEDVLILWDNDEEEAEDYPKTPSRRSPYSAWALGLGEWGRGKAESQNPSFHTQTGGAMLGVDCTYPSIQWGLAALYFHSTIDQAKEFGSNTLDAASLCAYSSFSFFPFPFSSFCLELSAWNGYQFTENKRNVFFSMPSGGFFPFVNMNGQAISGHSVYIGDGHIKLEYTHDLYKNNCRGVFEPFISADWAWNWEAGYKEEGASPYNMQFPGRFSSLFQAEAGANFSLIWDAADGAIIFSQKASYLRRVPFGVGTLSANVVGQPGSFTVLAFHNDRNLFSPCTKLSWRSKKGNYASLLYEGEFGSHWMLNEVSFRIGKYF